MCGVLFINFPKPFILPPRFVQKIGARRCRVQSVKTAERERIGMMQKENIDFSYEYTHHQGIQCQNTLSIRSSRASVDVSADMLVGDQ